MRHGLRPDEAHTMRKTIRDDILFFGIPALIVFTTGLIVCGQDGYNGLTGALWGALTDAQKLRSLTGWNIAGLLVFLAGLGFAIVAVMTLKRFYASTLLTREDHEVIIHGIYSWVRHPIYLGVLVAVQGPAVYGPSLRGSLVMLLLVPIILNRIRMEERMLIDELGDAYREFKKTTKKLIPFVY
jgi:protein-S-isoprenylcysteine O-methyltransferase Ste14